MKMRQKRYNLEFSTSLGMISEYSVGVGYVDSLNFQSRIKRGKCVRTLSDSEARANRQTFQQFAHTTDDLSYSVPVEELRVPQVA